MPTDAKDIFTANDADRLEQQQEVTDETPDDDGDGLLGATPREANEADVVEQARSVTGDDDYPRGPIDEEPA
ncbi:hypothetical protein [Arthrobacter sp.]|uniref:hypothetical protein n=1 Tax=Arthrobacter sp. TaxID=1667 RepID=UPI0028128606|nr:hypothetical protein [Arthrobacter sp.]